MARKPRIDVAGTLHHVMVRGLDRQTIFRDDVDRKAFLKRVRAALGWGKAGCLAWAIMPNHAHFVLLRGAEPLAEVMRRIKGGYAQYFNRRYGRTDTLFGGRYKSKVVDGEVYLTELVRYVHLNPVKANLVTLGQLQAWPWTGHAALMGEGPRRFLEVDEVLAHFGGQVSDARVALQTWMSEGLKDGSSAELIARLEGYGAGRQREGETDTRVVGDAAFADKLFAKLDAKDARRARVQADGWTLERVLAAVCSAVNVPISAVREGRRTHSAATARAITAYLARTELEATVVSVARETGVTSSAVTAAIPRGEAAARRLHLAQLEDLPAADDMEASGPARSPPTLELLLTATAAASGVRRVDLAGPSRARALTHARRLFCAVAIHEMGLPTAEVAAALGRDRAQVYRWAAYTPAPELRAALQALLPDFA